MAEMLGSPISPNKPKLLNQVREVIRRKHDSIRTEQAYCDWIKRFILFHRKRHPAEMAEPEITAFLTYLAAKANVAASTQNQALSALLFLYREVLKIQRVPWLRMWIAFSVRRSFQWSLPKWRPRRFLAETRSYPSRA